MRRRFESRIFDLAIRSLQLSKGISGEPIHWHWEILSNLGRCLFVFPELSRLSPLPSFPFRLFLGLEYPSSFDELIFRAWLKVLSARNPSWNPQHSPLSSL